MPHFLERMLFPRRVTSNGDVAPKGFRTQLYQWLFERGWSVPWIYSPERCARFWDVPAGLQNASNRPEDYAFGPTGIMQYVLRQIAPWVPMTAPVLEIGCNAGSKLEQFRKAGFPSLSGVEMNPACFDVMRQAFPELFGGATLYAGSAEQILPTLDSGGFSFVYSISSIQHVHPAHHRVFDEIARVCKDYLLTLEIEWAGGPYFFPRNYRRIFESRGFAQLSAVLICHEVCPEPELSAYWGHIMRLFVKKNPRKPLVSP